MLKNDNFYKNILENLYDGVYFVDRNRKILYWNKGAERITSFNSSEVVGKSCSDNILIHVDDSGNQLCTSGCPLSDTMSDLIPRNVEVYLHHKQVYRVPVSVRTTPILDLNGKAIGAVEIFSDNTPKTVIAQKIKELEKMAMLDALTGLANRRYVEINIQTRLDEAQRYGWRFGVLLIDLDHFKKINDIYGHNIGDRALQFVSKTLLNNARVSDLVGRWGGEEFIAIIPNINEEQLYFTANKLRVLVEQSGLYLDSGVVQVTVSIGATLAQPKDTIETLLERADKLLYYSKTTGRNRVSIERNLVSG